MPISPDRMKLYPGGGVRSPEWQAIRRERLLRAGNCCEGTSQFPHCRAANHAPHPKTRSRVVLTIAHMDQDETNNDDENLRALCQRCHNAWDAKSRAANAAITRARKRNQPELFQVIRT